MDAIPIGFKESIPLAGSTGIGTAESKHEEREQYSLVGSGRGLSPDEFVVEKSSREFYEKNNKKIGKCYPVDLSKKRGQVLIINMNTFDNGSPRQGSERDVLNLKRLFEELNFIVTVECNLSKKDLKNAINLFSQDEKHREYSCCFVFLLSHGAPMYSGSIDGQWGIVCRDGNKIDVEKDVIDKFSTQEAKHLIGKPKFIIINACRGFSPDYANFVAEGFVLQSCEEVQSIRPYRSVADIAIVKSSVPGYASIRDKSRGTWCIETLCEEFRSKAWNKDVLTLFQLTDEALSRKIGDDDEMQTLEITIRGLNKKLYLYPGL